MYGKTKVPKHKAESTMTKDGKRFWSVCLTQGLAGARRVVLNLRFSCFGLDARITGTYHI